MIKNMKRKNVFHQYSSECIWLSGISELDRKELLEEGYMASYFPDCIYTIDCKIFNHPHHGIGMRNINGGVEFLDFENMSNPITLHEKGISVITSANENKDRCNLFLSIADYLAFCALVSLPVIFYDGNSDSIILNNFENLSYFLVESEDYTEINLFMPNTESGKTLTKTILDRNVTARDWSYTYTDYSSLQTYLHSYIKDRNT